LDFFFFFFFVAEFQPHQSFSFFNCLVLLSFGFLWIYFNFLILFFPYTLPDCSAGFLIHWTYCFTTSWPWTPHRNDFFVGIKDEFSSALNFWSGWSGLICSKSNQRPLHWGLQKYRLYNLILVNSSEDQMSNLAWRLKSTLFCTLFSTITLCDEVVE